MSEQPDRMDLHEFRASRRRKTDNLLKEDHRDLKRFFALDSAAYRDLSPSGGLDEKTKELLGLVASTVLRCNDCIAYHCDQCVKVGWTKAELLDALNVSLVIGGSITIPHIRTVWEVVEQLYEEKDAEKRAKEGHPSLQAAAAEVKANVVERDSDAIATLGLPPEATSRKARAVRKASTPAPTPAPVITGTFVAPTAAPPKAAETKTDSKPELKPKEPRTKPIAPPVVKPDAKPDKKSQGV